jgi:hypothetical protein
MRVQGYPDPGEGLRLHLNENTGGCSPRVLEAIRRLSTTDVATYPSYPALVRRSEEHQIAIPARVQQRWQRHGL